MAEDVVDTTTEVVDEPESREAERTEAKETMDATERAAASRVDTLLEQAGCDDLDELMALVKGSKEIREQIGDKKVDKLLKDSETLARYEEYWAQEKEKRRRAEEDPEDTVKRLEAELQAERDAKRMEAEAKKAEAENARAIKAFESDVKTHIEKSGIPEEYRKFATIFMGVGNPAVEVDIANKQAVKGMADEMTKKLLAFEQTVIKRYRAGKSEVPKVSKAESPPAESEKAPKTMRERRNKFHAMYKR